MATATVSASVDVHVKEVAGSFIRNAGLTTNEVIRTIWQHIALTGEIPCITSTADVHALGEQVDSPVFLELMHMRKNTRRGTGLSTMTIEDFKTELENKDV
ncbi:MAG: hypothetical protein SOU05_02460 [Atopobium sp.]|uniref:hypothetical protein n=1 Tax=Atopobium sp. TaxID=1872650 RepID=UPI002A75CB9A|nr:hypothetical protein [Atopobium sp.]MDY2788255.1 hypothetical protein [Atopobium sp.]MDY4522794.1 hypothetical protein [Atopobium sp.]